MSTPIWKAKIVINRNNPSVKVTSFALKGGSMQENKLTRSWVTETDKPRLGPSTFQKAKLACIMDRLL